MQWICEKHQKADGRIFLCIRCFCITNEGSQHSANLTIIQNNIKLIFGIKSDRFIQSLIFSEVMSAKSEERYEIKTTVIILRDADKEDLLNALGLQNESIEWVAKSRAVAEKEDKFKRDLRQKRREKN